MGNIRLCVCSIITLIVLASALPCKSYAAEQAQWSITTDLSAVYRAGNELAIQVTASDSNEVATDSIVYTYYPNGLDPKTGPVTDTVYADNKQSVVFTVTVQLVAGTSQIGFSHKNKQDQPQTSPLSKIIAKDYRESPRGLDQRCDSLIKDCFEEYGLNQNNNSFATAFPLENTKVVTATADTTTDPIDLYSVILNPSTTYQFSLTYTSLFGNTRGDMDIYLYSTPVFTQSILRSNKSGFFDEQMTFSSPAGSAAPYYILVRPFSTTVPTRYELSIQALP